MRYDLNQLPILNLIVPSIRGAIELARLDERIARSPVGQGFLERTQFTDACASLWIDGELVDLVLHDDFRDIRTSIRPLADAALRVGHEGQGGGTLGTGSRAGTHTLGGDGCRQRILELAGQRPHRRVCLGKFAFQKCLFHIVEVAQFLDGLRGDMGQTMDDDDAQQHAKIEACKQ